MAGPALLKTILQFFSSSEAGLVADPTACEVAPGADLWWGPESKRPRNHSGKEDSRAPSGCDGRASSLPLPLPPHSMSQGWGQPGYQVLWLSGGPACPTAVLFWDGARERVPLEPFSGNLMLGTPFAYTCMSGVSLYLHLVGGCLLPPFSQCHSLQGAPAHGNWVRRVSTMRSRSQ